MATLKQLAQHLDAKITGAEDATVTRVSGFADATPDSVVFAAGASALQQADASAAGAIITDCSGGANKPVLRVDDPRLAFARAAQFLKGSRPVGVAKIHPTAVLGSNVELGEGVVIDAGCVLGDGVVLGAETRLYPRVVIYPGCQLGKQVVVHAGAVLGADGFGYVREPETGEYIQFPQQGALIIEDRVEIGANTTIDRGALGATRIGQGTKIDNLVHIAHNVTVGRNVVIAAQTGISGSSAIGDDAVIGGQVGIADHVSIGRGAVMGAQAGVPSKKKIDGAGEVFWGTPARPLRQVLREMAVLARISKKRDG